MLINHCEHVNASVLHSAKEWKGQMVTSSFCCLFVLFKPCCLLIPKHTYMCSLLWLLFCLFFLPLCSPKKLNGIIWGRMFLEFPVNSTISHSNDPSLPPRSLSCHKQERCCRMMATLEGGWQIRTRDPQRGGNCPTQWGAELGPHYLPPDTELLTRKSGGKDVQSGVVDECVCVGGVQQTEGNSESKKVYTSCQHNGWN